MSVAVFCLGKPCALVQRHGRAGVLGEVPPSPPSLPAAQGLGSHCPAGPRRPVQCPVPFPGCQLRGRLWGRDERAPAPRGPSRYPGSGTSISAHPSAGERHLSVLSLRRFLGER